MSASPAIFPSSQIAPRRSVSSAWVPVILSLIFIAFTSSTLMSGYHTQFVVSDVWKALFGGWHDDWIGLANFAGRKVGHFFGYGAIGLVFRNAWHSTLRHRAIQLGTTLVGSRLMVWSTGLSALSIFLVACLDELHQHFLPQRVGSFGDVLRDTSGAIVLNVVFWTLRSYKRRKVINAL